MLTSVCSLVVMWTLGIGYELAASLQSQKLDLALAAGRPPESSRALALRARRLTSRHRRLTMAKALRRIVRDAKTGPSGSLMRISLSARAADAADVLTGLADALTRPSPVSASGAAQAWILLTDGTGPLYDRRSPESLRRRAAAAESSLRSTGTAD
jgi:hypothetical protein